MSRRNELHNFGLFILIALLMFCSSCRDSKTHGPHSFRLSRGGYSPSQKCLLFAAGFDNLMESYSASVIGIYDFERKSVKYLHFPADSGFFDFAWVSGQAAFVETRGDRMIMFHKDESENSYNGTAIKCPVNLFYIYCSWNPKGQWLAVNCNNLGDAGAAFVLGLYNSIEEKFMISDIAMNPRPPIWKDDDTLLVTNDNNILEISLESGAAKLVRTIPLEEDITWFYGIFDDKPLVQTGRQIKLGDKILTELDLPHKFRVITTQSTIFVSSSPTKLIAFDLKGSEISRTNPERKIQFGSVGEDPNTVYGLNVNMLLRIYVESDSLNIQNVYDLAESK
jgi:hypothetical protein